MSPLAAQVEEYDPSGEAFGGMAFAAALVLLVGGLVSLTFFRGYTPEIVQTAASSSTNLLIFAVALVLVSMLITGVMYFVGKASR